MATPGFPLPLRNALATLACDALDAARRARGARVAGRTGPTAPPPDAAAPPRGRAPDRRRRRGAARRPRAVGRGDPRARRARAARGGGAPARGPVAADDAVGRAVVRAAALWSEGLFFEVHEVLEAVWQRESGRAPAGAAGADPDRRRLASPRARQPARRAHAAARGTRPARRRAAGRCRCSTAAALLAATAPAEIARSAASAAPGALAPPSLPLRAERDAASNGPERTGPPALVRRSGGPGRAACPTRRGPHGTVPDRRRLAGASSATPRASAARSASVGGERRNAQDAVEVVAPARLQRGHSIAARSASVDDAVSAASARGTGDRRMPASGAAARQVGQDACRTGASVPAPANRSSRPRAWIRRPTARSTPHRPSHPASPPGPSARCVARSPPRAGTPRRGCNPTTLRGNSRAACRAGCSCSAPSSRCRSSHAPS